MSKKKHRKSSEERKAKKKSKSNQLAAPDDTETPKDEAISQPNPDGTNNPAEATGKTSSKKKQKRSKEKEKDSAGNPNEDTKSRSSKTPQPGQPESERKSRKRKKHRSRSSSRSHSQSSRSYSRSVSKSGSSFSRSRSRSRSSSRHRRRSESRPDKSSYSSSYQSRNYSHRRYTSTFSSAYNASPSSRYRPLYSSSHYRHHTPSHHHHHHGYSSRLSTSSNNSSRWINSSSDVKPPQDTDDNKPIDSNQSMPPVDNYAPGGVDPNNTLDYVHQAPITEPNMYQGPHHRNNQGYINNGRYSRPYQFRPGYFPGPRFFRPSFFPHQSNFYYQRNQYTYGYPRQDMMPETGPPYDRSPADPNSAPTTDPLEDSSVLEGENDETDTTDLPGSVWDDDLFKSNRHVTLDESIKDLKLVTDSSVPPKFQRLFPPQDQPRVVTMASIVRSLGLRQDLISCLDVDNNGPIDEALKSYLFNRNLVDLANLRYGSVVEPLDENLVQSFQPSENILDKCLDVLKNENLIKC